MTRIASETASPERVRRARPLQSARRLFSNFDLIRAALQA